MPSNDTLILTEEEIAEEIRWLRNQGYGVHPTGSYEICDPPVTDTDRDFLVYQSRSNSMPFIDRGYSLPPSQEVGEYPKEIERFGESFLSYTKGQVNLIVTSQSHYFHASILATRLCKKLNLLDKEDRIAVFRAIRHKIVDDDYEEEAITSRPHSHTSEPARGNSTWAEPISLSQTSTRNPVIQIDGLTGYHTLFETSNQTV